MLVREGDTYSRPHNRLNLYKGQGPPGNGAVRTWSSNNKNGQKPAPKYGEIYEWEPRSWNRAKIYHFEQRNFWEWFAKLLRAAAGPQVCAWHLTQQRLVGRFHQLPTGCRPAISGRLVLCSTHKSARSTMCNICCADRIQCIIPLYKLQSIVFLLYKCILLGGSGFGLPQVIQMTKNQLGTCQNKIGNPFIDTLVQRMQIAITLEQLREECLEPKLRGLGWLCQAALNGVKFIHILGFAVVCVVDSEEDC